ncbi:hypothetical protein [Vibrio casei]|nr:hypothetical protein [Vibrio casei]
MDYLEAVHQSLCSFGIDTAIVEHALTPTELCQSGDASEEAVKVVASQI